MGKKMNFFSVFFAILLVLLSGCASVDSLSEVHGDELKQDLFSKSCEKSNPDYKVEVLGYVEERDDIQKQWYGFIVCKITDLTKSQNNFEIKIGSNWVTGTSLTEERALQLSQKAEQEGKGYFTFGEPYNPVGDLDPKRIEYRFYQQGGAPTNIEVYIVLRKEDRAAKPEKTLRVGWPGIEAQN